MACNNILSNYNHEINLCLYKFKQFSFFDLVPVKDTHDLASPPEIFKNTPEISNLAPSSSGLLLADIHGSIHLLNHEFVPIKSWIAHSGGGRVTHMVERKGVLVTLGEEDGVRSPLLKIWDLEKVDKKLSMGTPVLLRSAKVQTGNRPHPVSSIALSDTLSHLAIGLADGTVLLYRYLDQSIFSSSTSLTSIPKPRTIHESPTEPITGLGFREPIFSSIAEPQTNGHTHDKDKDKDREKDNLYLFIVTTSRVLSYQASGRVVGSNPSIVDEVGAGLGCAVMDWHKRDIVVAREEAVYVCGVEGRETCYAYEGSKSSVHTHLNYLVIVSPPFIPSASSASATVRNFARMTDLPAGSDITKVTVFDLENKLVAYSGTFEAGVREVVSQWGRIFVLENDGRVSCLEEKPTSAKLDMLYRKSLYVLALNMAKSQRLDESSVADIHRQYGDHLYTKGDYDGAMAQFVKTIGWTQPSYVIRKFLDAQRIHNLVTYLQELHSLGLANADHTTLLLNTYTKLKDVTRLDTFIKTESRRKSTNANGDDDGTDELPFDLDTAIRVCRQAGYFKHASYLAKKYERHEDYLRIQIEDAKNFRDALMYLRKLGPEAAESNLARYGRAMLESLPEETTQLLIDLCTNSGPLILDKEEVTTSPTTRQSTAGPSYLSYLALNRSAAPAPPTVSSNTAIPPSPSVKTVKLGDTASRRDSINESSRSSTPPPLPPPPQSSTLTIKPRVPAVKRLSPRLYFPHFVDHMDHFVVFLETVARRRWGQSVDVEPAAVAVSLPVEPPVDEQADKLDQIAVWNTLLELYLTLPAAEVADTSEKSSPDVMRDKALRVLKSESIPYDPMHGLILCSSHSYTPGLVLLWEKMGMYEDVLRFWMDRDSEGNTPEASSQVVHHLNLYDPTRPHLYPLVLRFLTSSPELLSRHTKDIEMVLEHIEREKIMPPLGVIQVLSRNGVASVGLVKQWLMTRIKESREEIHTDQQLIDSYRLETKTKLKQVEALSDPEHPRVFHVTRCSMCSGQLDLPSVHFMCDHSYHQRCLADHETECPNCAREHGVIREIRRNNERLADQHELFLSEVQENGFSAVATGFSRGVLNMTRLEEVAT
ncbi:hypothetical protein PILCRDRAFT_76651 [Piloderma croceum F 1598]|uniref:E3 ubiquitin-protein ligase PEP5 n=1 Tax=Piloderma croceum (strain F 1598) TaxID=765440 RepID=A0A0C3EY79_PILCF|nr:hypothetical protein PILCRDRAFT_76651 [Piloderma croceum F 1598]